MSTNVHPSAIVSPKAQLGANVTIGPYSIVEDDVIIGDRTTIASSVIIANGARIGKECKIHHGSAVATLPQDLKFQGEPTTLEIGDGTIVREFNTLHRGTTAHRKTVIGSNCFLMAYVHVAHDCTVGNNVILANAVNMGGHVVIDDYAFIGGIVPVHQHCRIGAHAMIGGGFRVVKDVPPFVLAGSEPLAFTGLNVVGLRRRGFPKETIEHLKRTYDLIYNSKLNVSQAIERIKTEVPMIDEVRKVVEFIESSKRGIIWTRR